MNTKPNEKDIKAVNAAIAAGKKIYFHTYFGDLLVTHVSDNFYFHTSDGSIWYGSNDYRWDKIKRQAGIVDAEKGSNTEINDLELEFSTMIEVLEKKLRTKIETMEKKFSTEIEALKQELSTEIEALEQELTTIIEGLLQKLTNGNRRLTAICNKTSGEESRS